MVKFDDVIVFDGIIEQMETSITHEFDDSIDEKHLLAIELLGKTSTDTEIDGQGNIVRDSMIEISDFCLDDVRLGQVFFDNAVYQHDFNGTADVFEDSFHGSMGCNGTVKFEFFSPAYLWLLEKF
jgi:hypothetical protein